MPHRALRLLARLIVVAIACIGAPAWGQQAGSIRGLVVDRDVDAPLPFAEVTISETGAKTTTKNRKKGPQRRSSKFGE